MKKTLLTYMKIAWIVLFVSYYIGSSFFYHDHTFSWGKVTHSHPLIPKKHQAPAHTHTTAEIHLIQELSSFFFYGGLGVVFHTLLESRKRSFYETVLHRVELQKVFHFSLRAPPAFISW